MKNLWTTFKDGFVGAFVLAGAIVMAVVSVAGAFVNGDLPHHKSEDGGAKMI